MTVDPRQNSTDQAIDSRGYRLQGQIYVPAANVQQFRATYGVDETSDAAGNHYVVPAVAPHVPLTLAGVTFFYLAGTTGTQVKAMTPTPGAGVMQYLRQVVLMIQNATAAQQIKFQLGNLDANGPTPIIPLEASMTDCVQFIWTLPDPIAASAPATAIQLSTIFPAASTARVDIALIGFNRAV